MNPVSCRLVSLCAGIFLAASFSSAQTSINAANYVTASAAGLLIPDPALGATRKIIGADGTAYTIPDGTAFVAGDATSAPFAIGIFEVTNAEWLEYVFATGTAAPAYWVDGLPPFGKMNHPVVGISWSEASAYCQWLSTRTGLKIALPTDAQWTRTAGGPDNLRYPWSNSAEVSFSGGQLSTRFNYNAVLAAALPIAVLPDGTVSDWADFLQTDFAQTLLQKGGNTKAVGSYASGLSASGCYDLAGNVAEWTASGTARGGSWAADAADCTAASAIRPTGPSATVGFRIVCLLAQ